MGESAALWGEVLTRLGLVAVGPIEDGLRYQVRSASVVVDALVRVFVDPLVVRIVVRPHTVSGIFLVAPAERAPTQPRWRTGDAVFDDQVAILAGGAVLLPRLGAAERERLAHLVGLGAIVSTEEATLEPAVTGAFASAAEAAAVIRELMRIAARLAVDPPIEELLDRWFDDDGAAMVHAAAARRVVELLPLLSEEQAETACRIVLERSADSAPSLLSVMPPYPCVLAAWFEVGDPLDPRVGVRVIDAWRAGSPRPAARYLSFLLQQSGSTADEVVQRVWHTPGLAEDASFVREFLRLVRREPVPMALPLLLEVQPKNSSLARRLARALSCFPGAEVDRRLLEWLSASSSGIRAAAAQALADRVADELAGGARHDRLEPIRGAAERSSELVMSLLEHVPPAHTPWLVPLRPHGEPDAVALIRRLGTGGADADDALLFWLDRGTLQVRLEAARALGTAGTPRALSVLRDRATAWFSDGGVREACRDAADQIRHRAGGVGNLAIATLEQDDELASADVIPLRSD